MGIPTSRVSRKVSGWRSDVIWQILTRETYNGVWRYGKSIRRGSKRETRPLDEQIVVNVPPIISRETWDLAQARRAYNSRIAKRKLKHKYLIRGLIFCGCGRRMTGGGSRNRNFYCYCARRYAGNVAIGSELCHEPLVDAKLIEHVAWNYIMDLITDPEQFEQKLRQAQAQEAATMRPKQKELDHVQALLKDTEKEADGITCGPQVMYRFVVAELISMGIHEGNIYLDMERRMKCGIGKCGHCQINQEYTCKDGPCFSYAHLKTLEEGL